MLYVAPEGRKRAEQLAERLGTEIDGTVSIAMWSLSILEALLDRIEKLEGETRRAGQ